MIFKLRIKSWQASLALTRLTTVVGVNSILRNGNHILMWDFDECNLKGVIAVLTYIQHDYYLPEIHILNSGQERHYLAYCFVNLPWIKTVEIISATPFVDQNYFRLGVMRKHWTLRISDKDGKRIKHSYTILSEIKALSNVDGLDHFVEYDTMKHGFSKKVIEIGRR